MFKLCLGQIVIKKISFLVIYTEILNDCNAYHDLISAEMIF